MEGASKMQCSEADVIKYRRSLSVAQSLSLKVGERRPSGAITLKYEHYDDSITIYERSVKVHILLTLSGPAFPVVRQARGEEAQRPGCQKSRLASAD